MSILPHREYRITCNLVDINKNVLNGKKSNVLAMLLSKGGKYGDIFSYDTTMSAPIQHYDFSYIEVNIINENGNIIDFHAPLTICLSLL